MFCNELSIHLLDTKILFLFLDLGYPKKPKLVDRKIESFFRLIF